MRNLTETDADNVSGPTDHGALTAPLYMPAPQIDITEERVEYDQATQDLIQQQLEVLLAEARSKRLATRKYWIRVVSVAAIYLVFFTWMRHFYFYNIWWLFGGAAGLKAMTAAQKQAASELAKHDDIRAVGPMIEMLALYARSGDTPTIENYLIRTLPRLRESDSRLLNMEQRSKLHEYLLGKPGDCNLDVAVAMLEALKRVGDSRSAEIVERLAANEGSTGRSQRIIEAARECLPYIRDLGLRKEAAQTLLRGSAPNVTASEILLRPVTGAETTIAPEELLRPVERAHP